MAKLMIAMLATAAEAAPVNGLSRQGPDWETILILLAIGGVGVLIAIMAAWLLSRFSGHRSLHSRSLAAGALPILLFAMLIIAGLVALDGMRVEEAVEQFLGMSAEVWMFFVGCFVLSWIAAYSLGWRLRRKVEKSNQIDPAVLG